MSKIKYLIVVMILFVCQLMVVSALDNKPIIELYSINDAANFNTDTFSYKNVTYSRYGNNNENANFNFESITNNSEKKIPVSIDILLFDSNKKNIGFVTYCSERDLNSDYAQFNLKSKESAPFVINVSKKYFVEGKGVSDIAYYSLFDDNKYCHIGGYDKYAGLTYEDIINGVISKDDKKESDNAVIAFLRNIDYRSIIIWSIVIIVLSVARGFVENILYTKIYGETPALSYLPIGTDYISVKLAVGNVVAKYYGIVFIIFALLSFLTFFKVMAYIMGVVGIIAFIIVIVKIVTKNYDLLMISDKKEVKNETSSNSFIKEDSLIEMTDNHDNSVDVVDSDSSSNTDSISSTVDNNTNDINTPSTQNNLDSNVANDDSSNNFFGDSSDEVVDLSYSNSANNSAPDFFQNDQDDNSEGGSDLTNMFR